MGIRISKDHLHPSVIESITSLIGDLSQLETTAKGNAVEAINELLANGGNKEELEALIAEIAEGKELIANAVGEPLTAEDSFDEMSSDINSLLSTFKTNMMNNGITVESGDKFKSLIDKIATMVEEGSGKGVQYAEGVYDGEIPGVFLDDSTMTVTHTLGSIPTIIFVSIEGEFCNDFHGSCTLQNVSFNSITCSSPETACKLPYKNSGYYNYSLYISEINDANFTIHCSYEGGNYSDGDVDMVKDGTIVKWYAIGVGEEDTTLRDSLASILENKGVDVTEEDDMASLITKVDEEFSNSNDNKLAFKRYNKDSSSMYSMFMIKNDGSLWACGYNARGQLGLGNINTPITTFTQVTTNINNDVKQVACGGDKNGYGYAFVIKNDGSLWACGVNSSGQLGLGDTTNRNTFTQVTTNINNDVKQVVCGSEHTFIIKNDGSIWSCGNNTGGQLGLGDTTNRNTFTKVTTNINNDVKEVICDDIMTYIVKNNGTVWRCGLDFDIYITTFTQL